MGQKVRKRTALRNAEYYDQQELFDSLYSRSKNNEVFGHLMDIITSPENIKLAYRLKLPTWEMPMNLENSIV